ncbi:MAG TPA: DUF3887 domain-containing protein [Verrucomicrobiae bacterium]|nr:DUF3887 domain-containing protein [Verrucomicrobiae bacterium]
MARFRRTLFWRDGRELIACVVVIIIFGFYYFQPHAPMARLGCLIVIGGAIFIACKLLYARRTTPPAPPGATVVESLRAELHSARTQSRLLGSVLWWYLLPLTMGELVFVWGDPSVVPTMNREKVFADIAVTVIVLSVNVFVYWLNQWARSKQLLPIEAQLESLLHSAETGTPLSETNAAQLRPIVLSLAAAAQVKAVEFKVAFWQIAVFGLPGIVGIWFFLMIGLPINHDVPDFTERSPNSPAPIYLIAETNRDTTAARKIVGWLNAGDWASLQKLYNAEMAAAFPPQKATDFFTKLTTDFGKIEKVEGPTGEGYQGWTAFRLECQRGDLIMSLALDGDDKIAGIYFKPAPASHATHAALIPRFLSWQRLAWLAPFFLGGLLYSRFMQKTTARAVGISAVGLHLSKGESLILWEEIKDVRPFKFLHIQNLWLIRESGEKMIMHWTPLERHAELKAVVERFAPANHPLRKYLSLLK